MGILEIVGINGMSGSLLVLFLLPIFINMGIILVVSITLPSSNTHSGFMLFVFVLILWQFPDLFIRVSRSSEAASQWAEIAKAPILFVTPLAMLFGLRFAGWNKRINPILLFVLLFLIPIGLLLGELVIPLTHEITRSDEWGWIANPKPTTFVHAMYYWISLQGIGCLLLFWVIYISKLKESIGAVPALLLAIGITIPTFGGIVWQIIRPLLFNANDVPITAPLVTVFSLLAVVAITKYRLLDYSPQHQWKRIVDLTREGILIVDMEDRIMYANNYFCNTLGYDFAEIQSKKAGSTVFDQSTGETMACIARKFSQTDQLKTEIQIITKGAEKIWVLFSSSPYLDSKGKVIGSMGILTDINNLKMTENKLKHKVDELNMFFYKSSHDLKTPAASIKGLVKLYNSGSYVQVEVLFDAIEKSVNRLMDTTDRLSQIPIISQRNPEASEINWNRTIAEILDDLADKNSICLCLVNIEIKEAFYSDAYLISLILRNAISNAFIYIDSCKSQSRIEISIVQVQGDARIVVSDNGCGIPEELHRNIFQLFTRGEARSGIGLGLYSLKLAVDKLGGEVSLKSIVNEGTSITILIPSVLSS